MFSYGKKLWKDERSGKARVIYILCKARKTWNNHIPQMVWKIGRLSGLEDMHGGQWYQHHKEAQVWYYFGHPGHVWRGDYTICLTNSKGGRWLDPEQWDQMVKVRSQENTVTLRKSEGSSRGLISKVLWKYWRKT